MLSKVFKLFMVFALTATINLASLESGTVIYGNASDSIQATQLTVVDGETETEVTEFPFPLSSLDEKTYTLRSEGKTFTLHVDKTAPIISLNVENGKVYKEKEVKVTISGASTHKVLLNGEEKGLEFTLNQNGNYTLKVSTEDQAKNTATKEVSFRLSR